MKFKKKIVIGYANPSSINDFVKIKSINKESYRSLNLRQTNLYINSLLSWGLDKAVYKEDKALKKYKITIERLK